MARRCDSRVASFRFFWAPVFARAWRALKRSARSLAFAAASEILEAVGSGSDAFSGMGSGCEGASVGGAAAWRISSAGSAVALVLRFFAGGI